MAIFPVEISAQSANIRLSPKKAPTTVSKPTRYVHLARADSSQKMVRLADSLPTIVLDIRYATPGNFTGITLYPYADAWLRLPAMRALQKAVNQLNSIGLTLVIFDAYRPYDVTKTIWNLVGDTRYAAHPLRGSVHNRGAAVDAGLASLSTKEKLPMPSDFDDFSTKAHHQFTDASPQAIQNRQLLRRVMEQSGFVALETEWWHYSLPGAANRFGLLNLHFDQLDAAGKILNSE